MRLIGFVGWSGAGKTTLLARVLPVIVARGLRVSTLKHAHHQFDVDLPGKDSHTHRQSGATEVLISSGRRFALMHELRDEPEWSLPQLLSRLSPVDLVIVEGFKRQLHPKIEVFRTANGKPPLFPGDPRILALATDQPFSDAGDRPQYALDDYEAIADAAVRLSEPVKFFLATGVGGDAWRS